MGSWKKKKKGLCAVRGNLDSRNQVGASTDKTFLESLQHWAGMRGGQSGFNPVSFTAERNPFGAMNMLPASLLKPPKPASHTRLSREALPHAVPARRVCYRGLPGAFPWLQQQGLGCSELPPKSTTWEHAWSTWQDLTERKTKSGKAEAQTTLGQREEGRKGWARPWLCSSPGSSWD